MSLIINSVGDRPLRFKNTPEAQQSLEQCRDLLYSLAKKMCVAGNEATDELIQLNYPGAKTTGKNFVNRKYNRTIEWGGEQITLIYDYKSKTAMVAQKGGEKKENEKAVDNLGNHSGTYTLSASGF